MIKAKLLGLICISILCGILVAGLWPFHAPRNQVDWLGKGDGLEFGKHATVLSSGAFPAMRSQGKASCSLEIWLEPYGLKTDRTFLAFYTPENPLRFSLSQYNGTLMLGNETSSEQRQTRGTLRGIAGAFREKKSSFITITSGARGTAAYLDGSLSGIARRPLSDNACTGRLVVGNSPVDDASWHGQLRGLAIYNRELTAAQVLQHYVTWMKEGKLEIAANEGNLGLYLFDEHQGRVIHNQAESSGASGAAVLPERNLYIPERYVVPVPAFLQRPWKEFRPTWSYLKDTLINVAGFIPLGFFFRAYFSVRQINRGTAATIILGGIVSLAIEVLQAYLPTRSSGMTDLITNTSGTWLGVMLYSCRPARSFV